MKKIILIFLALVMALSFAACSSSKVAPNEKNTQKDNGNVNSIPDSGENTQMEIKEPELVWWTIKTDTGIPTFVAELKNNNSVAVDFEFDVDYYLNGENICKKESLYGNTIAAGESIMIIDTWDIPDSADKIEIKYQYLSESIYDSVPVSILSEEKRNGYLDVAYSVSGEFSQLDTYVAFFSGETLVSIGQYSFFPGNELKYSYEVLNNYDSYKIYTNAYK